MMERREFTCIRCPMGCRISAWIDGPDVVEMAGATCKRGQKYVREEVKDPRRTIITTVRIEGGEVPMLPVHTKKTIPKALLPKAMQELAKVVVKAPVKCGDGIVSNILGTGADVLASRDVEKK